MRRRDLILLLCGGALLQGPHRPRATAGTGLPTGRYGSISTPKCVFCRVARRAAPIGVCRRAEFTGRGPLLDAQRGRRRGCERARSSGRRRDPDPFLSPHPRGATESTRFTYHAQNVETSRIANATIERNEREEIEITPEMVAAAEECAWDALSGRERFLSSASVCLILRAALEAGGFVVRERSL
jgi:hypothetical protein